MSASFRDLGPELDPPCLQGEVGGSIMRAVRTVLDALVERTSQGVKLRFPDKDVPSALGYIGNDRGIERGPSQTDASYASQLIGAVETWQRAGSARTMLQQLRLFFSPADGLPMRAVSNTGVWHDLDSGTGEVTKVIPGTTNWIWDGTDSYNHWSRGWVIVDVSGVFSIDVWGAGTWGDGGGWGSDMPLSECDSLKRVQRKWSPANVYSQIILTFDASLFLSSNPIMGNVSGWGPDPYNRSIRAANFFEPAWP